MKFLFLDFEFNSSAEKNLNLASLSYQPFAEGVAILEPQARWLYRDEKAKEASREELQRFVDEGFIFVAFVAEAEIRSMFSLGIETIPRFIDLALEWRHLKNKNNELQYGYQLLGSQVKFTTPEPPFWERVERVENENHAKAKDSLAAATYKLLGVKINVAEKDRIRSLIIKGDPGEIYESKNDILRYNLTDIDFLRPMLLKVHEIHQRLTGKTERFWLNAALERGGYAVRTARMIRLGYPVDSVAIRMLALNAKDVVRKAAEALNKHLPGCYVDGVVKQAKVRGWIAAEVARAPKRWMRTKTGEFSIGKDAFKAQGFDSESEGFPGAWSRYKKTLTSLAGFLPPAKGEPKAKKESLIDYIGSDSRARPFFNIFGAQTSRSQPKTVGYIPLKAKWMRRLIVPKPGRALCACDYASEEFLISAGLSQDGAMMADYAAGDIYSPYGRSVGVFDRSRAKAIVLGLSYDMTSLGLSERLECTRAQAQIYIDAFFEKYFGLYDWKQEIQREYAETGHLCLSDGWHMFKDNPNPKSTGNFLVQGEGAVIMRRAVARAQDCGLDVVYTNHDELCIEFDEGDTVAPARLEFEMVIAFREVMSSHGLCPDIRVESKIWSSSIKYIDASSEKDYETYREYFT